MNSITIISLVILSLLIYLVKYKGDKKVINSFYFQTFLIISISIILILNIINFKKDITSIIKIITLCLVLVFSIPKYIKDFIFKAKNK